MIPDGGERCRRISRNPRYITFESEGFHLGCKPEELKNLVEICPDGVQPVARSVSLRKGDHELIEAVNRIVPFLFTQGLKDNENLIYLQKVMAGRNAIHATNQAFQLESVIGLVMFLIFGHTCAYLLFIFELIKGNSARKILVNR